MPGFNSRSQGCLVMGGYNIKALLQRLILKFSEIKTPLLLAIACKLFCDVYLAILT